MKEKKGELFNQLAIISELIENVVLESKGTTVIFYVDDEEFKKLYEKVVKKSKSKSEKVDDTFSLKISSVQFMFSKNNA